MHRAWWESGAWTLSEVGMDLHRHAETGLMDVREEMSLTAAICCLWERRTVRGGETQFWGEDRHWSGTEGVGYPSSHLALVPINLHLVKESLGRGE